MLGPTLVHVMQGRTGGEKPSLETRGKLPSLRVLLRLVLLLLTVHVWALVATYGEPLTTLPSRRSPVFGMKQPQGLAGLSRLLDPRKEQQEPVLALSVGLRIALGKLLVHRSGLLPLFLFGLLDIFTVKNREFRNHALAIAEQQPHKPHEKSEESSHVRKEAHRLVIVLGLVWLTWHFLPLVLVPIVMDVPALSRSLRYDPLVGVDRLSQPLQQALMLLPDRWLKPLLGRLPLRIISVAVVPVRLEPLAPASPMERERPPHVRLLTLVMAVVWFWLVTRLAGLSSVLAAPLE